MGKNVPWYVRERIKRNAEAKRKAHEDWLHRKVYGRKGKIPSSGPSSSVRAVSTGFESSRRRH